MIEKYIVEYSITKVEHYTAQVGAENAEEALRLFNEALADDHLEAYEPHLDCTMTTWPMKIESVHLESDEEAGER